MFTDFDCTYNQDNFFAEDSARVSGDGISFQESTSQIKSEEDAFEVFFQTNQPQPIDTEDFNEDIDEEENKDEKEDCGFKPAASTNSLGNTFSISKDYSIRQKQAMKKKIERVKTLLGRKANRDYLVLDDNRSKSQKTKLSRAEMQEINLIKNRMAAQRSRDNHKIKMEYLESRNTFLTTENANLKEEIKKKDNAISYLVDKAKECETCRQYVDISSNVELSTKNKVHKNFGGAISLIGIFCFIGLLFMFGYGSNSQGSSFFNQPMRQLSAVDYNPKHINNYTNSKRRDFEFKPLVDSSDNTDEKYIENDVINYIIKYHPMKAQIVQLLQENLPVAKTDSKEKIERIKALREQFVIDLFNKLRVANSIQNIHSKSKKNQSQKRGAYTQSKGDSGLMAYKQPTCYNPEQLAHLQNMKTDLIAQGTEVSSKALKDKTTTLYVSDYISTTGESTTENEFNLDSMMQKINAANIDQDIDNEKSSVYLQLLFPVKSDQLAVNINGRQISPRNNTASSTNTNNPRSLYQVGCKVFSISKII